MERKTRKTKGQAGLRVVVVGENSVGKTSVVNQFVNGEFLFETEPGKDDAVMDCEHQVGQELTPVEIWDTYCNEEGAQDLLKSYYRRADAVVVVYDVTKLDTFKKIGNWHQKIFNILDHPGTPFLVFGNKTDLENLREVKTAEGKQAAESIGAIFYEGSALTELNVKEAFGNIIIKGYPRFIDRVQGISSSVRLTEKQSIRRKPKKEGKCCS